MVRFFSVSKMAKPVNHLQNLFLVRFWRAIQFWKAKDLLECTMILEFRTNSRADRHSRTWKWQHIVNLANS